MSNSWEKVIGLNDPALVEVGNNIGVGVSR
jgi:hypothetical protein